ncbi:MAG: hypothetical protein FGM36_13590, partial [Burkholderiaceae bacterium]|nr:hypothetical protein [Burkholderiaceae bacterium]
MGDDRSLMKETVMIVPFTNRHFDLSRRSAIKMIGSSLAAANVSTNAQARWRPEKPIVIYNPFAAGGVTDLQLRFMGERVSKLLGQSILIEIKAGAAGTLAP